MFYHIGLQANTTAIFSRMVGQSYWNMYVPQTEHECGAYIMLLRHNSAVLCEMFSIAPIITYEWVQEGTLHAPYAL
jgi:hypothetical protein